MLEFVSQSNVQATVGIAVLSVVVYFGIQVAIRLRPTTIKPDTNIDALSQNFEEMQLEGDIDEAELRKIRAVIGKTHDANAGSQ